MGKIKVVLEEGAFLPVKAHDTDAGFDIKTPRSFCIASGYMGVGSISIDTGVHVAIPEGYVGMIKTKSSINKRNLSTEGVIDSGYTGSVVVKMINHSGESHFFHEGDKIAQLVIIPIHEANEMEVVDHLDNTDRGDGGFGSTGR